MTSRLTSKLKKYPMIFREFRKLKIIGISFFDLLNIKNSTSSETQLFGKTIKRTDSFWYLHSLNELFIEEVYRFNPDSSSPLIIDCGSNIGLSIIYFKTLIPDAKIIGFEPDRQIFKILENNINAFEFKSVELNQKAVWTANSTLFFQQNGNLSGHISDDSNSGSVAVQTQRLKDLLVDEVDFLKIDIEGAEYEILKDCEDSLINVKNIFVEYHSFHENDQMIGELLILLKNAGFKIYVKEAWENMKNPYVEKKGPYFDLQLNIFGYRR